MIRASVKLAIWWLCLSGLAAQGVDRVPAPAINQIFSQFNRVDSPGCALGIISDGELVFARGYGQANLEYQIPLTSGSVFRIGSTSKQFTAMSIHLLAQDGKLSLDDDIRKYVPEIPDYGTAITIRHLLHHTSGLRDYLTLMDLAGLRAADYYTDGQVLAMLSRQRNLNFMPGEDYLYSNSGYFLLAEIVRRASGRSLREFAAERIFQPLGMDSTHFHNDFREVVNRRASGYRRGGEGFQISMTTLEMIGDGGVFTTIEDLAKWDSNFYTGQVGGRDLIQSMLQVGTLNDGSSLDYASGLSVDSYRGLPTVRHGGSFVGFRAELLRFPTRNVSVICLCNLAQTNPSQLADQVADVVLQDQFPEPKPEAGARGQRQSPGSASEAAAQVHPSPQSLELLQGRFHSQELGIDVEVLTRDGGLTLQNLDPFRESLGEFKPSGENRFADGRLQVEFVGFESGRPSAFRLSAGRVRDILFERSAESG